MWKDDGADDRGRYDRRDDYRREDRYRGRRDSEEDRRGKHKAFNTLSFTHLDIYPEIASFNLLTHTHPF